MRGEVDGVSLLVRLYRENKSTSIITKRISIVRAWQSLGTNRNPGHQDPPSALTFFKEL